MIDADAIGHEILLPPRASGPSDSVNDKVVEVFGENNFLDEDGLIDRNRLGDVVFADPPKRRQLNRLTYPRILLVLIRQLLGGLLQTTHDVVAAEVPLLVEGCLASRFRSRVHHKSNCNVCKRGIPIGHARNVNNVLIVNSRWIAKSRWLILSFGITGRGRN